MNAQERIKRAILLLPQLAADSESKEIKVDINLLMGVASHWVSVMLNRNTAVAKQCRPRKAKTPKAAPEKVLRRRSRQRAALLSQTVRMTLRTVLRRFLQFSREYYKLIHRWIISRGIYAILHLGRTTMSVLSDLQPKRLRHERQANPKPNAAARQSV